MKMTEREEKAAIHNELSGVRKNIGDAFAITLSFFFGFSKVKLPRHRSVLENPPLETFSFVACKVRKTTSLSNEKFVWGRLSYAPIQIRLLSYTSYLLYCISFVDQGEYLPNELSQATLLFIYRLCGIIRDFLFSQLAFYPQIVTPIS